MNYSKFRFTLDIHKHQSQISVPVMYGDTAVQLLITLSDGGMPYTIGKSCWAQFIASKPGIDEPLTRACLIEDGTTIRLDFDSDIANVAGVYNCEVRLYGAEGILTSPCFTMVVDPRVTNSIGMDSGEATNLLDQIGEAMAEFQKAETERDTAEQERIQNELARQNAVGSVNSWVDGDGYIIFEVNTVAGETTQLYNLDPIGTGGIANEAVTAEKLAPLSVTSDKIQDWAVGTDQLAQEAVATENIADGAVTAKKIAPGAVKSSHLAQSAVGSYELADEAVCDYHLDSALSDRLTGFDKTDRDLDRRISNIEEHISDDYFVTDDSVAYEKAVPARACSSAKLASFGGMTYKSRNLFPTLPWVNQTVNGVTFTLDEDGVYHISGTATEKISCVFDMYLPAGKYSVSLNHNEQVSTSLGTVYMYAKGANGGELMTVSSRHSVGTTLTTTTTVDLVALAFTIEKRFSGELTVAPMFNEGDYIPYELWYEGTRDSKVTEIKNHGANALPYPYDQINITHNGITFTDNGDGSVTLNGKADGYAVCYLSINKKVGRLVAEKTYIPSLSNRSTDDKVILMCNYVDNADGIEKSFTTSQVGAKVYPSTAMSDTIYLLVLPDVVLNNVTVYPMINEGVTAASFKVYREPISYSIPAEIQAINGYGKDGFVIDLEKQTSAYEGSVNPLPVRLEPIIEVEGGGRLEFVNEYKNAVPSTVKYLLKEKSAV